jgi:hypothetical protein
VDSRRLFGLGQLFIQCTTLYCIGVIDSQWRRVAYVGFLMLKAPRRYNPG